MRSRYAHHRLLDVGVETNVFSDGTARGFTATVEPQLEARIHGRTWKYGRRVGPGCVLPEVRERAGVQSWLRLQAESVGAHGWSFMAMPTLVIPTGDLAQKSTRASQFGPLLKVGTKIGSHKLQIDVNGSYGDVEVDESEDFMDVHLRTR